MATTTRHHIEMTRLDSSGNQYILYPKNTLDDVYTSSGGVSIKGKVNFYGACGTAADTTAKTASITGFSLVSGAHVSIVFTNGISVASATLNINSTGAKPIYFNGTALKANMIRANARVLLVFDGSSYNVISGAAEAPYVTNANTTKAYLLGTPSTGSHMPTAAHYDSGVYLDTTAGQLVATNFKGGGANLTSLNASNISSGTLAAARLATSGVTAGSYGPTADASVTHGGRMYVPQITVDTYGRVTGISNITITLPADNNTDTKVTNTLATTTKAYITGTSTASTNTGTQVFDSNVYLGTKAGYVHATRYCFGSSTTAYVDSSNYTGKAATVNTISGFITDNCTSSGTAKALSENQGRLLQNQITTLNSSLSSFQAGVDSIYNTCKTYGSTPSAKTPTAISTSIQTIYNNRYTAGVNSCGPKRSNGTSAVSVGVDATGPWAYFPYGVYPNYNNTGNSYIYFTKAQALSMAGGSGLTVKDIEKDIGYTFSSNKVTLPADAHIVVVETFAITSYNGYYPSAPSCKCTKGTVTKIRGGSVVAVPTTSDLKYAIGSWLVINGGGGVLTVIHGGKTNVNGTRKVIMLSI